jgi:hypothetical protein
MCITYFLKGLFILKPGEKNQGDIQVFPDLLPGFDSTEFSFEFNV